MAVRRIRFSLTAIRNDPENVERLSHGSLDGQVNLSSSSRYATLRAQPAGSSMSSL